MRASLTTLLVASLSGPLWAGDLAQAAERERERRKSAKTQATRTITDADLPDRSASEPPETDVAASDLPKMASSPAPGVPFSAGSAQRGWPVPADFTPSQSGEREAGWRAMALEPHRRIRAAEQHIADLRSGTRQHVHETSCSRRRGRTCTRMETLEEALERANADLAAAKLLLEALEDQARRARVPPGWLRER